MSFLLQAMLILQYQHHFLPAILLQNIIVKFAFSFVIIQMKNKYISFAQVLKRKQPKTLLEMFQEWQQNPRNKYVLHLDHSNTNRSNHNFSNMISSKSEQQGIMFDSWIEGLGSQNNQVNNQIQYSRQMKQAKKENGPKKIILTSRGKQNRNLIQQKKSNVLQQKSSNSIRSPALQIEMIHSKQIKGERNLSDMKKSPSSYKAKQIYNKIDDSYYKSQKPINSFNLQKESVGNNLSDRNKRSQLKEKAESKGELQKIINATDNIHVQIGEMAHYFVLQQKKRRQLEEQELLLSLQEQKRISLKSQNKQKIKLLTLLPENDNQNDIQKKLREEVKKQVGNFLKINMSKASVPNFGSKINPTSNESPITTENNTTLDRLTEGQIVGNVGFSFSNCLQKQNQNKHNQIPYLNIPQAPLIPEIPQIQSERNHSESNEQIYDFYQKWRQKENIYYEKHENAPQIQSVVYTNCNQTNNQYLNTLSKQKKLQDQETNIVENTFGKHQRQLKQVECNSNNRGLKSEEKPQILVTIPSNYKEMPSQLAQNKTIQLAANDYQSNLKPEILCLSASPQPQQMPEKLTKQYPILKQFQSNREIDLQVQQNNFTQKKVKQFIEEKSQNLRKSIQIQLKENLKIKQANIQSNEKAETMIQKVEKVQKINPNQHSNSFKLNKVYSSPKQNTTAPIKVAPTSQFTITQDKREEYKIPHVTMKYNGGKFNFAYTAKQIIHQKKPLAEDKVQKQHTKTEIINKQPKIQERMMANKIESYAYMKNNLVQMVSLKNSIKQQEKQEFQFDF